MLDIDVKIGIRVALQSAGVYIRAPRSGFFQVYHKGTPYSNCRTSWDECLPSGFLVITQSLFMVPFDKF